MLAWPALVVVNATEHTIHSTAYVYKGDHSDNSFYMASATAEAVVTQTTAASRKPTIHHAEMTSSCRDISQMGKQRTSSIV